MWIMIIALWSITDSDAEGRHGRRRRVPNGGGGGHFLALLAVLFQIGFYYCNNVHI